MLVCIQMFLCVLDATVSEKKLKHRLNSRLSLNIRPMYILFDICCFFLNWYLVVFITHVKFSFSVTISKGCFKHLSRAKSLYTCSNSWQEKFL